MLPAASRRGHARSSLDGGAGVDPAPRLTGRRAASLPAGAVAGRAGAGYGPCMTAKLSLTHLFPCTPAELFDLLDDPALDEVQSREANMQREVVERRVETDGTRFKRVRCRPNRTLPGFLAPLVGPEGLVYFQVTRADAAAGLIRWSVEAPAMGERLEVGGTTRIEPHAEGCRRTIEGQVTVKVRLLGGQIERFVADEVQKSYDRTARAMAAFIAARRDRPA